jgi:hypothetical protein
MGKQDSVFLLSLGECAIWDGCLEETVLREVRRSKTPWYQRELVVGYHEASSTGRAAQVVCGLRLLGEPKHVRIKAQALCA